MLARPRPLQPRIAPLPPEALDDQARELLGGVRLDTGTTNIFTTLVRHPGLFRKWLPFGGYLLNGKLPARDREILILRIGWLCQSTYEWAQHVQLGRTVGLTDQDLDRIKVGPDAEGLDPFEAVLLQAADELHHDHCLSDATWAALAERYDERQMVEVPFVAGHYTLVSYVLNSLGVPLEEGAEGF